jgi:hypothetical protein
MDASLSCGVRSKGAHTLKGAPAPPVNVIVDGAICTDALVLEHVTAHDVAQLAALSCRITSG